jgi:hypothetical protein
MKSSNVEAYGIHRMPRDPEDSPLAEWIAASLVTCGWAVLVVFEIFHL